MKPMTMIKGLLAGTALALTGMAASAQDDLAEKYSGETVTIMIGHPPGGSYDLYAQLAAEFMGDHIPGNPNVIVQHMPGGGGRKGSSYFLNNTEPDGMTLGIFPDTLGHIQLLEPDRADWDANTFRYIGRFANANAAFVVRSDAPATTIDEMRDTETIVACTGKGARSGQQPTAVKNLAGLKFRVICGYKGSSAAELAVERDEADIVTANWASFRAHPDSIESGDMKVFLQAGLERDPELQDVPLLYEITDDEEAKKVLRFVSAGAPIGRSMMIHPDTDDKIVEMMRGAFEEMINSEEFLAEAKKRSAKIDYLPGEKVEEIMHEMMSASPELVKAAQQAMDASSAEEVEAE